MHRTADQLEAALEQVRKGPVHAGTLELIVTRPRPSERRILHEGILDLREGMVGDRWSARKKGTDDQITVTGARYTRLIAGSDDPQRWAEAGDQLYVDFDISHTNLPTGSRFAVGEVVLEVTPDPHLGCGKYVRRFGADAMKVANTEEGRELRLRGLHARVIVEGTVRPGDPVRRI
jgi:MOSC domain-containing protein YiiM